MNNTKYNALELPNVVQKTELQASYVYGDLGVVVWELASKYPRWTFKVTNVMQANGGHAAIAFEVFDGRELLGAIQRGRTSNGGPCIVIHNKRIEASMSRQSAYKTVDPLKAIAKVKKMFSPSTVTEKIERAQTSAGSVVGSELHTKNGTVRSLDSRIREAGIHYLKSEEGAAAFASYLSTHATPENKATVEMMEQVRVSREELRVIENVSTIVKTAKSVLIIVDGGKYLAQIDSDVQIWDDNTLPVELRGKLGLLKLVNNRQFVSDVGCRVEDDVFIVIN